MLRDNEGTKCKCADPTWTVLESDSQKNLRMNLGKS